MNYSYGSTYKFNRSNFEKSKTTDGFKAWRKAQYAAQSGHCAWCYEIIKYKDMDVDHIWPVGRARYNTDVNDFDNLVLACHECNRDKKAGTTFNEIAYKNTLNKLSRQQKQDGYAPKKLYWERTEWIGPNKYTKSYRDYKPIDILELDRNVWLQDAPLVRDYSLKINNADYMKEGISNKISDNSDAIWVVVKWALIIGVVGLIIFAFSQSSNSSKSTTNKIRYCDYECQEAGRMRYEAEEAKKRQKEKEEEYEEAKRYWNCKNAGGSDFDCG